MNPLYGGPSQGIRNSIPELKKFGVCNEVVSLDDPTASFIGKDLINVIALGPSLNPWRYTSKLIPWLLDNLIRFDAVIVHGIWAYHSYATLKAIKILKKKFITDSERAKIPRVFIMPHGMLDPYFQKASDRKIKALRNWVYWKLIEGNLVNKVDGLLFTCKTELLLARQPFHPYKPKREINVGYGIQEPPSYIVEMRQAFLNACPEIGDRPYFLFISRIHKKKGVDLLVRAYAEMLDQSRNINSTIFEIGQSNSNLNKFPLLVIAGPGLETAYGRKIQQFVSNSIGLRECILFTGMLTGNAKWGSFYGCEAFVLPSHQENFGIAVVEALACGKPVLISNQVNIWKEIEEMGSGLVANDSIEGTRNLLERWENLTDTQKLKMGELAKVSFKKNFSISSTAKNLLDAIST